MRKTGARNGCGEDNKTKKYKQNILTLTLECKIVRNKYFFRILLKIHIVNNKNGEKMSNQIFYCDPKLKFYLVINAQELAI